MNPQSQQFFDEARKPPEEDGECICWPLCVQKKYFALLKFTRFSRLHVSLDMIGPDEDLTGVAVEEDDTDQALEAALTKARRLRLAEGSSLQKVGVPSSQHGSCVLPPLVVKQVPTHIRANLQKNNVPQASRM